MMSLEEDDPVLFLSREEILGDTFNSEYSSKLSSFVDRAVAFDFSPLLHLMQSRKILEQEGSRAILVELVRFLILAQLEEEETLLPSLLVHSVWELLLLFVREYVGLCGGSFDSIIRYDPLAVLNPSEYVAGYSSTLERYKSVFGVELGLAIDGLLESPRTLIWPAPQLVEAALTKSLALGRWSGGVNGEIKGSWQCMTCAFVNVRASQCNVCGSTRWRPRLCNHTLLKYLLTYPGKGLLRNLKRLMLPRRR